MNNLESVPINALCDRIEFGARIFVSLKTKERRRVHSAAFDADLREIVLATILETDDGAPQAEYLVFDDQGRLKTAHPETEGALPVLFSAPDGKIWTRLASAVFEDQDEIILPLGDRKRLKKAVRARALPASRTLSFGDETLFYAQESLNEDNPDRMSRLAWNGSGLYKNRKTYKIPPPNQCRAHLNEEGLHLISFVSPGSLLHRLSDPTGELLKSRTIRLPEEGARRLFPLSPSFERNSAFLSVKDADMSILAIGPDESLKEIPAYSLDEPDDEGFYAVFDPIALPEGGFAVRFNTASRSGYLTFKDGAATGGMTAEFEGRHYQDMVDQSAFDLLAEGMTLTTILPLSGKKAALVFDMPDPDLPGNEIKILIREI